MNEFVDNIMLSTKKKNTRAKLNEKGVEHIVSHMIDQVMDIIEVETRVVRKLSKKDIQRVTIKLAISLIECYTEGGE